MDKEERQRLLNRLGHIPGKPGFKRRARIHQGWWRMNVLMEKPGPHPREKDENVCNTILGGQTSKKNFLTENTMKAVEQTLSSRKPSDPGMVDKDRLYNNLLSSQPLCFNFFGELMMDTEFGLKILQNWWPDITLLRKVIFEYAPDERYTNDNSAFDVAFEVEAGDRIGLIGLECKYTDSFSASKYAKQEYKEIFSKATSFRASYKEFITSRYNQLFRNQQLAEALLQNNKYKFVHTGLFCYHHDLQALHIAEEFKNMLVDPSAFKVITYSDFIGCIQRMNLVLTLCSI